MAAKLIPCPDCGARVSPRAPSCPQCGGPIGKAGRTPKRYGCGTLVLVVLGLLILVGLFVAPGQPERTSPAGSNAPAASTPPTPPTPAPSAGWHAVAGDRVVLSSPQYLNVTLCSDFEVCERYARARSIGDQGSAEDPIRAGLAVRVPLPVRAIVEDTASGAAQVRITGGEFAGRSGWISKDRIDTEPAK